MNEERRTINDRNAYDSEKKSGGCPAKDRKPAVRCPKSAIASEHSDKKRPVKEISYNSDYFETLNRRLAEKRPPAEQNSESLPSEKKKRKKKSMLWKTVRRTLLVLLVLLLLFVAAVFGLCYTVAHGPSPTVRNLLVSSAMQTSAAKWVPGLFLSDDEVKEILDAGSVVRMDEINIDDYVTQPPSDDPDKEPADEWADAVDGMQFITLSGSTYKAYLLIVKDPERVYVATASDFQNATAGIRLFDAVEREQAVAAINGGEFDDSYGQGTGATPIGLTFSKGEMVWNDNAVRTFVGFDKDNRMVVSENMTEEQANELGIRDAVCFQRGNILIDREGDSVRLHYNYDNGVAQRTAIGQRADGAVLLLVTDGRSASSLGATHNDLIEIMAAYGAVTAAKLDGGSSTMMYYRDYAEKYGIDESVLDDYQKQGMVNKYKAFTNPRRIPTYFMVQP